MMRRKTLYVVLFAARKIYNRAIWLLAAALFLEMLTVLGAWWLCPDPLADEFHEYRSGGWVVRVPQRDRAGVASVVLTNRVIDGGVSPGTLSATIYSAMLRNDYTKLAEVKYETWFPVSSASRSDAPQLIRRDVFGWPIPSVARTMAYDYKQSDFVVLDGIELRKQDLCDEIEERSIFPTKILWPKFLLNFVLACSFLATLVFLYFVALGMARIVYYRCVQCGYPSSRSSALSNMCPECGSKNMAR